MPRHNTTQLTLHFCNEIGKHLCTVCIMNSSVTSPLSHLLFHVTSLLCSCTQSLSLSHRFSPSHTYLVCYIPQHKWQDSTKHNMHELGKPLFTVCITMLCFLNAGMGSKGSILWTQGSLGSSTYSCSRGKPPFG